MIVNYRYEVIQDYSFLRKGHIVQLAVEGYFYPADSRWFKPEYRLVAGIVCNSPTIFKDMNSNASDPSNLV